MIQIEIPGWKSLHLEHVVLDYNGTLAFDGCIKQGVYELLEQLSHVMDVHVITADTFGSARASLEGAGVEFIEISGTDVDKQKLAYVEKLGSEACVCIGNGRNDCLMLKQATLGIAVVQEEGASLEAVLAADVVICRILDALELLLNPLRLVATLRK